MTENAHFATFSVKILFFSFFTRNKQRRRRFTSVSDVWFATAAAGDAPSRDKNEPLGDDDDFFFSLFLSLPSVYIYIYVCVNFRSPSTFIGGRLDINQ